MGEGAVVVTLVVAVVRVRVFAVWNGWEDESSRGFVFTYSPSDRMPERDQGLDEKREEVPR